MQAQDTVRTMKLNGITFCVLIDDLSREEAELQASLWGKMHQDYVIEKKTDDRRRFYISENLYGRCG